MLIKELLFEFDSPVDEIVNNLMDMIIAYTDRGLKKIPMTGPSGMVEYMRKIGYILSPDDVMQALENPQFDDVVERSTPNEILLSNSNPSGVSKPEMEKSKDKVQKDAQQQALKSIKTGGNP